MQDHVDEILSQWHAERPDLDVSPMAIIGRVSAAARLAESELRRTFARHDLDSPSFDVLATLRRSGPPYRLTAGQLTRAAMVTSGAITQRLDRLEGRGLVIRSASASDGRAVHVTLTAAGYVLVERALPDHLATERRLLARLSEEQRHALADGLRLLLTSIGESAGHPRHNGAQPLER